MAAATATNDMVADHATGAAGQGAWLLGKRWDLTWLIGSAIIVPLVLAMVWTGVQGQWIDLTVTLVVGGPHILSTALTTWADPGFRRNHMPFLLAISVAVPSFVTYLAIKNVQLLLSLFIFAASLHVLQQNVYLTDLYRLRSKKVESRWSRWLDTGVLMLCIYPIAAWKLVHDSFFMGGYPVLLPKFLHVSATYYAVFAIFFLVLFAWIGKTIGEWRRGELNVAKTLLIALTSVVAFWAPAMASEERMEFAFQSINAWHSFQYLALVWLVLYLRKQRGIRSSKLVEKISGGGKKAWAFYGTCVAAGILMIIVVRVTAKIDPLKLSGGQYFYMFVLSALLMHYAADGYMFAVSTRKGALPDILPYAAPVDGEVAATQAQ